MIASILALGLGVTPVLAESSDAAKKQDETHKSETIHAPTNRMGEMVPTMTAPGNKDDATQGGDTSGTSPETLHAPTNRVGDQVPTMTAPENDTAQ
jgi:hypothetical protein